MKKIQKIIKVMKSIKMQHSLSQKDSNVLISPKFTQVNTNNQHQKVKQQKLINQIIEVISKLENQKSDQQFYKSLEMKWKPDNIEEFVQYKIQHPEESFITLKNYQAEKKHNQHIEHLHKQLSKSRAELNYFKSELFKLNQVSGRQISQTSEEIKRIDTKIDLLGKNLANVKCLSGISSKQRKKLMISEYEIKINKLNTQNLQEVAKIRNYLEKVREEANEQTNGNRRNLMLERIKILKSKADKKKTQRESLRQKNQKISELYKKYDSIKEEVEEMRQQVLRKKLEKEEAEKQMEETKSRLLNEMRQRLEKLKCQFTTLIDSQASQINCLSCQELCEEIQSAQMASFRMRKCNETKQKLAENIKTLREYLRRLEQYLSNNLNSSASPIQTNIDEFFQEKKLAEFQSSKIYIDRFSTADQIQKLSQYETYQSRTKFYEERLNQLKKKSAQFFEIKEKECQTAFSNLQLKQKQLEKEIVQLQAKVTKTDLEINKFIKNKS